MKVYVTDRGVRCPKRVYTRRAGLSRKEAAFFKRRGVLDVPRTVSEVLVSRGWATTGGPTHYGSGSIGPGEPIPVVTSELAPEVTTAPEVVPDAETDPGSDAEGEPELELAPEPDESETKPETDEEVE